MNKGLKHRIAIRLDADLREKLESVCAEFSLMSKSSVVRIVLASGVEHVRDDFAKACSGATVVLDKLGSNHEGRKRCVFRTRSRR